MLCFNNGIDGFQELARRIKVTAEGELAARRPACALPLALSEADGHGSPGGDTVAGTEAAVRCPPSLTSGSTTDPRTEGGESMQQAVVFARGLGKAARTGTLALGPQVVDWASWPRTNCLVSQSLGFLIFLGEQNCDWEQ